jgi:hypothetical protein
MLLSMHVHFLIITYIHISCIFLELVSQCASVRMIQFFYILIYSIHVKVYCYCLHIELLLSNRYCLDIWTVTVYILLLSNRYCLTLNCYCLDIWTVTVQLLLSRHWTVTVWTLNRFLTISKVLKLHFKWDWSR